MISREILAAIAMTAAIMDSPLKESNKTFCETKAKTKNRNKAKAARKARKKNR